MSKFTLGQRQFPTLGLRSQQPKNYVGPTLSCYLGIRPEALLEKFDILIFKPSSHNAGMAPVHPGGGQPVYRAEPGNFSKK